MKTLKTITIHAWNFIGTTMNKCKSNAVITAGAISSALLLNTANAYAEELNSNTSSIDTFIDFVCDWLLKIGGIIALVGGVMFVLGWQREDAEGKSRGLLTMMAGFMLAALSQATSIFGL